MITNVPNKFSFVNCVGWKLIAERIPHSDEWHIETAEDGTFVTKLREHSVLDQLNSRLQLWTEVTEIKDEPEIDPVLKMRLDYFQVHIEAVRENLASLEKAFDQLKHDVKG